MDELAAEDIMNEIVQVYLPSTNIRRSVAWYQHVFGYQVIWEEEQAANLKLASGPHLFIKRTSARQPIQFQTDEEISPVLSFKTSNLEGLHAKLKASYDVGEILQHGEGANGAYQDFYIQDPDGNLIEISNYPDLVLEKYRGY